MNNREWFVRNSIIDLCFQRSLHLQDFKWSLLLVTIEESFLKQLHFVVWECYNEFQNLLITLVEWKKLSKIVFWWLKDQQVRFFWSTSDSDGHMVVAYSFDMCCVVMMKTTNRMELKLQGLTSCDNSCSRNTFGPHSMNNYFTLKTLPKNRI
jgi:hypothetical protein